MKEVEIIYEIADGCSLEFLGKSRRFILPETRSRLCRLNPLLSANRFGARVYFEKCSILENKTGERFQDRDRRHVTFTLQELEEKLAQPEIIPNSHKYYREALSKLKNGVSGFKQRWYKTPCYA